jgi:hypothetical protein
MNEYNFPCEPVANPESVVVGPQYRFTLIDDKVLRYEWAEDGVFEDRASTFAINRKFPKPEFRVEDSETQLEIITPSIHLTYDKQRFSPNGFVVTFFSKQTDHGGEFRFGNPLQGNLGGTARTLDDVDGRCDMGIGILSYAGYAALDDSSSMLFDGNGFVTTRRAGDRVDGYLFAYGLDYKGAMRSFYAISGPQPRLPRWSLGNWWSRYYAYEQAEYLTLMDKFKDYSIPLSVAVIDMDWHRVKGDDITHTGWTGYTWNKELIPEPEVFLKSLHDRGLKTTLNDHPHAGVHRCEDLYETMAKALGHNTANNAPILFDPTSPKFMHAYLNVLHRALEKQGCDFWWIDWQQGSYTRIPGFDPLWLLNHFQYLDQKQNKTDSLPLTFSRYAGPGSHRYPVGFSGDTLATWETLEFQPEFTATASNIGYGWWSHDIGGHVFGYRNDECATRWVQFGVFSPILRLHSSRSQWTSKEPWCYRDEGAAIMRDSMQLRHRLVPYIYSISAAPDSSVPLITPLYWTFPTRRVAYQFPNQYYFGPSLVVAPIVRPRDAKTNLAKIRVWVPPGRHVDIFTGSVYDGDREIDMYRPLKYIPVLAPEGSIIPLDSEKVPANGCANPAAFEVLVVVGADGQFTIIEDSRDDRGPQSGASGERSILIKFDQAAGRLTVPSAGKEWTIRFISLRTELSKLRVLIDDSVSTEAEFSVETTPYLPTTVVKLPKSTSASSLITIELGANPQLAVMDYTKTFTSFLIDFQVEINTKDKIWEVLKSAQPTAVKISRLLSLGLEEAYLGPFAELMLSDSRGEHGGCSTP